MLIYKATEENLNLAAEKIIAGDLVAFPTETVYGLGADGLNPIAAAKIFEAKKRPSFNPLILHVDSIEQMNGVCETGDAKINILIENFMPGALTLVLPKKEIVPDIVTAGLPTVAVRMPDNRIALELIKRSGTPIAAPSANSFGFLSPTNARHVEKQLGNRIDFILDGGQCKVGVESTILQIDEKGITLLRPGGVSLEAIEKLVGKVELKLKNDDNPNSPGQLKHHYSPNIPLIIFKNELPKKINPEKTGALFFTKNDYGVNFKAEKILSPNGDLREAAANLFFHLHELEKENIDLIISESVPDYGLGKAIMDRLKRAETEKR